MTFVAATSGETVGGGTLRHPAQSAASEAASAARRRGDGDGAGVMA